jgi:CRISPR/Cas system-associated exonuclease Cas4 (RecB family)
MVMIPAQDQFDKTLLEIDKVLEQRKSLEAPRHYLGMSEIGEECWRKLFYSFRNAERKTWLAPGVKATEDGFIQEDLMAFRLRLLPYIELYTTKSGEIVNTLGSRIVSNKDDKDQIGFNLLLGHFRGHCDGVIRGIKEAPQTWHTWEHKSVNKEKFKKLIDIRKKSGEKSSLVEWDRIYYEQAIIYMHELEFKRHYLTVTAPGGREYISIRTEYDAKIAEGVIAKAKVIIFDNWDIPSRLSNDPEFYKCKWCEFHEICHEGGFPLVNCKTCRYSEPVQDGQRQCLQHEKIIPDTELNIGCKDHVFNPALVAADLVEHQQEGCLYHIKENDIYFSNTTITGFPELDGKLDAIYTSQDLREKIKSIKNITKDVVTVQKSVNGTIEDFTGETSPAWDKEKGELVQRLQDVKI